MEELVLPVFALPWTGCSPGRLAPLEPIAEEVRLVRLEPSRSLLDVPELPETVSVSSLPMAQLGTQRWGWPLQGVLTSGFGPRGGQMHEGLDLAAPTGTLVYAPRAGLVVRAGELGTLGLMVELLHGERLSSRYGHLSEILVAPGARIASGQPIGRVGATGRATGPHLHWEIREEGRPVDPRSRVSPGEQP